MPSTPDLVSWYCYFCLTLLVEIPFLPEFSALSQEFLTQVDCYLLCFYSEIASKWLISILDFFKIVILLWVFDHIF